MGDEQKPHAALAGKIAEQGEYLALYGHVEGRGRLVGEQEAGFAGQRHGDHDALAHTAGKLVRVVADAHVRRGYADQPEQFHGFGERGLL